MKGYGTIASLKSQYLAAQDSTPTELLAAICHWIVMARRADGGEPTAEECCAVSNEIRTRYCLLPQSSPEQVVERIAQVAEPVETFLEKDGMQRVLFVLFSEITDAKAVYVSDEDAVFQS